MPPPVGSDPFSFFCSDASFDVFKATEISKSFKKKKARKSLEILVLFQTFLILSDYNDKHCNLKRFSNPKKLIPMSFKKISPDI